MATIHENTIKDVLSSVIDPRSGQDIVSTEILSGLMINGGHVLLTLEVDPNMGIQMEDLRQEAERAVSSIKGVQSVQAILTAERAPQQNPSKSPQPSSGLNVLSTPPRVPQSAKPLQKPMAPKVKHIIAVASGKGGVGKSTVAVNLAASLQHHCGLKVGLMDADIYGPSIPRMLGINEKPVQDGDMLIPVEAYGLKTMSMGFLVDEEVPVIWRGPKIQTAVQQFLSDVDWGELDVLVVDMPPGTGDVQLTMAQKVPLSGAVIVSTPQDIALLDAVKGVNMFVRVNVPILGMIENMSHFCCPNCDHISSIFGQDGAKNKAKQMGVPFLGEIPLHPDIRLTGDDGVPLVISHPESASSKNFIEAAKSVYEMVLNKENSAKED